jgi:hypothetical protein
MYMPAIVHNGRPVQNNDLIGLLRDVPLLLEDNKDAFADSNKKWCRDETPLDVSYSAKRSRVSHNNVLIKITGQGRSDECFRLDLGANNVGIFAHVLTRTFCPQGRTSWKRHKTTQRNICDAFEHAAKKWSFGANGRPQSYSCWTHNCKHWTKYFMEAWLKSPIPAVGPFDAVFPGYEPIAA